MQENKKKKSKVLSVIGVIILIMLVLIILLPILLKNQIADKALAIANENVNAQIAVESVSLSLIPSFPDLQFGMKGLQVSGKGLHSDTDLAKIGSIYLDIDLKSALKKQLRINSILIENPQLNAVILEDGSANWEIAKPASAKSAKPETRQEKTATAFSVLMQNFQIRNASLSFEDRSQNMKAEIGGLDLDMSGDFTTSNSRLNLELDIASLNFMQAGVKLAHELKVLFTAAIGIDLENMKFSFKENQLKVNELELGFEGSVEMPDDGSLITDLRFNTQKTDFVTLLSFVPAVFMEGFEDLKTEGNLQFTGYSKGVMKGETLPAFGIDLKVANALVQYPRLPASIHDINIDMQIVNPGGSADKTTVSVKRFELYLADNPVSAELFVSTPVSDPDITADLDMNLDLGTIRDVIPLGNIELSGKLTGRMNINTRMSTIKQEEYEEVGLQGGISLENFRFASADLKEPVKISKANLKFTPRYVELKEFKGLLAGSAISLDGRIENFIPFVLQDKTLLGNLNINSSLIDANKLTQLSGKKPAQAQQPAAAPQVVIIPDNIKLNLNCQINKILFDRMEITNLTGSFELAEAIANLVNLRFDVFNGSIRVSGKYEGKSAEEAAVTAQLKLWQLDSRQAFRSFKILQQTLPVLDYSSGHVSGNMYLDSRLNQAMQPVLESINSDGNLNTSAIVIENSPVLNKIADNIKNNKLKKVRLSPANISYTMTNGNLNISPFKVDFLKSSSEISGTVSANQQMEISLKTKLAIDDLGDEAKKQLNNLVSQINKTGINAQVPSHLDIPIKIVGNISDPQVQMDWRQGFNAVIESLKDQLVKAGTDKVKDEAKEFLKGLFKK